MQDASTGRSDISLAPRCIDCMHSRINNKAQQDRRTSACAIHIWMAIVAMHTSHDIAKSFRKQLWPAGTTVFIFNFGPCYCYGSGMRWSRVSKCLMMASDSATFLCLCLNYTAGWGPGRLRLIRCRPRLRFRGGGSRALRWSVCRQQSDGLHGWTRCWLCCGLCRAWHVPVGHLVTFFRACQCFLKSYYGMQMC